MSRVFLIEENLRYDLTALKEFGQLVFLCEERQCNAFNTDHVPGLIRKRLKEHGFDHEIDFVCMTGQNLKIAMFLAVVVSDYGSARLLMFDAKSSSYRERLFDLRRIDALPNLQVKATGTVG